MSASNDSSAPPAQDMTYHPTMPANERLGELDYIFADLLPDADLHDPPTTTQSISSPPFGINPDTRTAYQYPSPSPNALLPAAPSSIPTQRRRSTRRIVARAATSATDRVYKTTTRHRQSSQLAHAAAGERELENVRSLHDMIPTAHQSTEMIKEGGTKERTRAVNEARAYIGHLEGRLAEVEGRLREMEDREREMEEKKGEVEEGEEDEMGNIDPALLG